MLVTKHEWELQKFHVLLSTVLYAVPPKQFSCDFRTVGNVFPLLMGDA